MPKQPVEPTRALTTRADMTPSNRGEAGLPAPVKRAATAVAVGAVLQLGAGLAGKYLLKRAGRAAGRAAVSSLTSSEKEKALATRGAERAADAVERPDDGVEVVSEMLYIRRVFVRKP